MNSTGFFEPAMDGSGNNGIPAGLTVSRSFTHFHELLWNIALGNYKVQDVCALKESILHFDDLPNLANMVQREFATGLENQIEHPPEEPTNASSSPHPFDVYLMNSTSGLLSGRRPKLAVCLPMRFLKRPQGPRKRPPMIWFDGNMFLPLEPEIHIRKVASLSGSARSLAALDEPFVPESLMAWGMERSMLVSAVSYDKAKESRINPAYIESMNESQIRAVATVVSPSFKRGFFAIQGPPGCGKTVTMVGMICAIGEGVIVTAPSNAAVANIALKLFGRGRYNLREVCVFGDNCDESVRFMNPKYRSIMYRQFREEYDRSEGDEVRREKQLRYFGHWLHLPDESISVERLAHLCPHIDEDEGDDMKEFLSQSLVIFCTLNSAGSGLLRSAVKGQRCSTFMIDEAGQCPEAEFFIATTFPDIARIVVVGDPKQLPATVIDPACKQAGYGKSWLSQVFDNFPDKMHLLDTQYRMDPEILAFPNARFYSGRILSGDNVHGRHPHVATPFQLVDTQKRGREERDGFSWKNLYEAMVIKSILRNDKDIVRVRKESFCPRTIVITPYKAQEMLLKEELGKLKGVGKIDVSTVDSFQGQEGDIVILSTVRTDKVGFTDDEQRLNVALTRAMRVLRVVGDVGFFLSLPPQRSTLRALALRARDHHLVEETKLQSGLWSRPNWDMVTLWKPKFTERFHQCIRKMDERDKNICFNTFFAVAIPRLEDLHGPPVKQTTPSWQMSGLRGQGASVRIVWIALEGFCVEAHFAGTRKDCLQFMQTKRKIPAAARVVKLDLLGLENTNEGSVVTSANKPIICWPMNNNMQNFISKINIEWLPQGNFCLDPHQDEIATASPPLMIESRSGTGKTNVLFQHAIFHPRVDTVQHACFTTVSPRLRNDLERRYDEVNLIANDLLPRIRFFSLRQLLTDLLVESGVWDFQSMTACTFLGYCNSRSSHMRFPVDANLAENEIGGVIMGSLESAVQGAALSRDQYRQSKRSNVPNDTQEGLATRNLIYDEYERYARWKRDFKKFDQNDVVARLLKENIAQLFGSAYLDEVQDFSYATIFLICNIAGKDAAYWVCAGDTAQMISPGCSFTFAGLKQTLLAVKEGIEESLSRVHHLLVNYRTTKDVLDVGNQILCVAKNFFPGAIEFAHPEVAVKDLGLKVVLCDWDLAW